MTKAMVSRFLLVAVVGAALAACGDSGPEAPVPGPSAAVCAERFCVDVPSDWEVVEATAEFVSMRHPAAPDIVLATVGPVSMEAVVTAAGGQWPQQPDAVVRSFWQLIDDGEAEMSTLSPLADGSVESFGTFADGRLWYRLIPTEFGVGIGVEMRAPNAGWAPHAEIIVGSVTEVP